MTSSRITVEDFRLILEDVLQISNLEIGPETTAKDVASWNSLNHVRLLIRVEQEYGIDIPVGELEGLRNVGEFVALINKLAGE